MEWAADCYHAKFQGAPMRWQYMSERIVPNTWRAALTQARRHNDPAFQHQRDTAVSFRVVREINR